MSRPAISTSPSVGRSSRISVLIRVVLPQPVGPTRKTNCTAIDAEADVLEGDVAARIDLGHPAHLDDRRAGTLLCEVLRPALRPGRARAKEI